MSVEAGIGITTVEPGSQSFYPGKHRSFLDLVGTSSAMALVELIPILWVYKCYDLKVMRMTGGLNAGRCAYSLLRQVQYVCSLLTHISHETPLPRLENACRGVKNTAAHLELETRPSPSSPPPPLQTSSALSAFSLFSTCHLHSFHSLVRISILFIQPPGANMATEEKEVGQFPS